MLLKRRSTGILWALFMLFMGTIHPQMLGAKEELGAPDENNVWMSQKYATEFRGIDVGDVNGDGLNEIVTIDCNNVYIFQKRGDALVLLQKLTGGWTDNYLGIDIYPLRGGKAADIIVTSVFTSRGVNMYQQVTQSFVISWQDGEFRIVARNLPWLFRVIPYQGVPRLVGQELAASASFPTGTSGPFDTPIYEMGWNQGKVVEMTKLAVPTGLPIYGLAIDNLGEGRNKVIAFDHFDHLLIMEQTNEFLSKLERLFGGKEILFRSDDVFGGSNIHITLYGQPEIGTVMEEFNYYLNPRIITYDFSKSGKRKLIVPRNDAPSGRLMRSVRDFTATEFVCFRWESIGLAEEWRTKKLGGYAADYQLKDADNDGEEDLVLVLTTSALSPTTKNSVIAIYKFKVREGTR